MKATLLPLIAFLTAAVPTGLLADPATQATRIYQRLAGVPPSAEELSLLVQDLEAGAPLTAALRVLDQKNPMRGTRYFYTSVLNSFFSPWSNEISSAVSLNDFSATLIGMVRDEIPFNQVLTGNFYYVGDTDAIVANWEGEARMLDRLSEYAVRRPGRHYNALSFLQINLGDESQFVRRTQTDIWTEASAAYRQAQDYKEEFEDVFQLTDEFPAGVLTTDEFAKSFYHMGTNRRAVQHVFKNFLCRDIWALHDSSTTDVRVRRDVDRRPGGDTNLYLNQCKGCHSGMDAMAGAFAYFGWNELREHIEYRKPDTDDTDILARTVHRKMNQNAEIYTPGYITRDDSWMNPWTKGKNAALGWNTKGEEPIQGQGHREFGQMITESEAFPLCMAQQVMQKVCIKPTLAGEDLTKLKALSDDFKKSNFNMKRLFASAAVACSNE